MAVFLAALSTAMAVLTVGPHTRPIFFVAIYTAGCAMGFAVGLTLVAS